MFENEEIKTAININIVFVQLGFKLKLFSINQ